MHGKFCDMCFWKTIVGLKAYERVDMHVIDVFHTRIFYGDILFLFKFSRGFSHFLELISFFVNLKT